MSAKLGIPVAASPSSEEATRDAAIICTATTSSQPVIDGESISPGTHINAIGANHMKKRELDAGNGGRVQPHLRGFDRTIATGSWGLGIGVRGTRKTVGHGAGTVVVGFRYLRGRTDDPR